MGTERWKTLDRRLLAVLQRRPHFHESRMKVRRSIGNGQDHLNQPAGGHKSKNFHRYPQISEDTTKSTGLCGTEIGFLHMVSLAASFVVLQMLRHCRVSILGAAGCGFGLRIAFRHPRPCFPLTSRVVASAGLWHHKPLFCRAFAGLRQGGWHVGQLQFLAGLMIRTRAQGYAPRSHLRTVSATCLTIQT